jgi:4-hydroxy-3-methylbut-2-enyl diphosphate reductase IspH
VVGSKNSSNSNRLAELAQRMGKSAFLIDDAKDIQEEWVKEVKCVGVTAGASAPDILVQSAAVTAAMNAFNRELLANHIRTCVADDIRAGNDEVVDELLKTLQKLMK